MNKSTALFLILLAVLVYAFWRLRQGPGRYDAGLPADPGEWQAERDRFLAGLDQWREAHDS